MDASPQMIEAHMMRIVYKNYPNFVNALKALPPEARYDLERFLRDVDHELMTAKRNVQMWPGGPRIRM